MTHITNWPLAWQVAEFIIDHPEEYDQTDWCDCFAGHVLRLSGLNALDYLAFDGDQPYITCAACNALGMPHIGAEFWKLFSSDVTLFELLTVLKIWAEEDGVAVPATVLAARAVALAADREAEAVRTGR